MIELYEIPEHDRIAVIGESIAEGLMAGMETAVKNKPMIKRIKRIGQRAQQTMNKYMEERDMSEQNEYKYGKRKAAPRDREVRSEAFIGFDLNEVQAGDCLHLEDVEDGDSYNIIVERCMREVLSAYTEEGIRIELFADECFGDDRCYRLTKLM